MEDDRGALLRLEPRLDSSGAEASGPLGRNPATLGAPGPQVRNIMAFGPSILETGHHVGYFGGSGRTQRRRAEGVISEPDGRYVGADIEMIERGSLKDCLPQGRERDPQELPLSHSSLQ